MKNFSMCLFFFSIFFVPNSFGAKNSMNNNNILSACEAKYHGLLAYIARLEYNEFNDEQLSQHFSQKYGLNSTTKKGIELLVSDLAQGQDKIKIEELLSPKISERIFSSTSPMLCWLGREIGLTNLSKRDLEKKFEGEFNAFFEEYLKKYLLKKQELTCEKTFSLISYLISDYFKKIYKEYPDVKKVLRSLFEEAKLFKGEVVEEVVFQNDLSEISEQKTS